MCVYIYIYIYTHFIKAFKFRHAKTSKTFSIKHFIYVNTISYQIQIKCTKNIFTLVIE